MILKNMGLVKGQKYTLYFNDRYWEVIKVWGMLICFTIFSAYVVVVVPGKFNIAFMFGKKGKVKKKNRYYEASDIYQY